MYTKTLSAIILLASAQSALADSNEEAWHKAWSGDNAAVQQYCGHDKMPGAAAACSAERAARNNNNVDPERKHHCIDDNSNNPDMLATCKVAYDETLWAMYLIGLNFPEDGWAQAHCKPRVPTGYRCEDPNTGFWLNFR